MELKEKNADFLQHLVLSRLEKQHDVADFDGFIAQLEITSKSYTICRFSEAFKIVP